MYLSISFLGITWKNCSFNEPQELKCMPLLLSTVEWRKMDILDHVPLAEFGKSTEKTNWK